MIYDEDQDLRQLLDEGAKSYSPDRDLIMSRVADGRSPSRRTASGGAMMAAAAAVFLFAGFVWVLGSGTGPESVATVSDDLVATELDEPSPQADSDADQIDTEDLIVGEADQTTTTSTAESSATTDGSDTIDEPATTATPTTLTPTTATPTPPTTATPTTTAPPTTATPTTVTPTTAPPTTAAPTTTTVVEPTTTTVGIVVDPPDSCYVQTDGIEVFDSAFEFAESYAFFNQSGGFVLNTSSLGPADDIEDEERSIEWTIETYGYEHSQVYSVAAVEPEGGRSEPVICRRHVLLP